MEKEVFPAGWRDGEEEDEKKVELKASDDGSRPFT